MKLKIQKHTDRALKIEKFIKKNKLFCIIVIILIIFLVGTQINSNVQSEKKSDTTVSTENEKDEEDDLHWRFYSIDLWILLIGGGFCSIMIVRERRKAKEKLQ